MNSISTMPPLLASLARIADFDNRGFDVRPWPRDNWETGDYVLGEVIGSGHPAGRLELTTGREMSPVAGDTVVGAFGVRAATLEAVGDWREIGSDGVMDAMTAAGLFGHVTSKSSYVGSIVRLQYRGHIVRGDAKVSMGNFVDRDAAHREFNTPVVLILGTSMSSGKTVAARVLVRTLVQEGLRVVGAKLTGAGRYRDILAFRDSGACAVYDFVDAGLPSTVCSQETYEDALEILLSRIAGESADVVVAEAGASPLEPYNGNTAVRRLQRHLRCTVLCATDPYAVVGVTQCFGFQPDLVAGVATSTTAGCQVVERLTGLRALNFLNPDSHRELAKLVKDRLSE